MWKYFKEIDKNGKKKKEFFHSAPVQNTEDTDSCSWS